MTLSVNWSQQHACYGNRRRSRCCQHQPSSITYLTCAIWVVSGKLFWILDPKDCKYVNFMFIVLNFYESDFLIKASQSFDTSTPGAKTYWKVVKRVRQGSKIKTTKLNVKDDCNRKKSTVNLQFVPQNVRMFQLFWLCGNMNALE